MKCIDSDLFFFQVLSEWALVSYDDMAFFAGICINPTAITSGSGGNDALCSAILGLVVVGR